MHVIYSRHRRMLVAMPHLLVAMRGYAADTTESLRLQRNPEHYACLHQSHLVQVDGVDDKEMYNLVTVTTIYIRRVHVFIYATYLR